MNNGNYNYTDRNAHHTTTLPNIERDESNDMTLDETPTLRDQFAMAALTSILTRWVEGYNNELSVKEARMKLAKKCYKLADAMMEARK